MSQQTMSLPPPEPTHLPLAWHHEPVGSADAPATTRSADADFAAFYRDAWPAVARGLAATIGDRTLAAEATDEAMARAYERWSKVGTYDFPAGWVYRVGLNWARSHHRRLARAVPLRRAEHVELGAVAEPTVRAALLELPVKLRSVVVCRLLLDWSVEETAAALHIPEGTVKSRLSRALTTLEATLGHLRSSR
jgi:RNA polymerase sigma-70 factor, ECF subfamily